MDDVAKRGHRLITAQHEAALSTIEWIDTAQSLATYSKVANTLLCALNATSSFGTQQNVLLKLLEQMLATYSFYSFAYNSMKGLEPYLTALHTQLTTRDPKDDVCAK